MFLFSDVGSLPAISTLKITKRHLMVAFFVRIKRMLLDFIFPRRCLGCSRRGRYFCASCAGQMKPFKAQICPGCKKGAIFGKTHLKCRRKTSLAGLISFYPYQGIIKTAITKLKYQYVTDLAQELVTLIHQCIKAEDSAYGFLRKLDKSILVPVPLHWRREKTRGFNQAALLGELLAQEMSWQYHGALKRKRYTKPQLKLKKDEREENVKDVFSLNLPTGQRINGSTSYLIFDDVWTTGSTLNECGQTLKRAGAKEVWGLTLAR